MAKEIKQIPNTKVLKGKIVGELVSFLGGEDSPILKGLIDIKNISVAGGAILSASRGTKIEDLDLYPETEEALKDTLKLFDSFNPTTKMYVNSTYTSDNAISYFFTEVSNKSTFGGTIQVIRRPDFIGNPLEVIRRFDLNACKAFYKFSEDFLYLSNYWYEAILTNKLKYNYDSGSLSQSLKRIKKYKNKGFEFEESDLKTLKIKLEEAGILNEALALEAKISKDDYKKDKK